MATDNPTTLYAAYVSTAKYGVNGITLHRTERDALLAVLAYVDIGDDPDDEYIDTTNLDDGDLAELVASRAEQSGDDWYVCAATVPPLEPEAQL